VRGGDGLDELLQLLRVADIAGRDLGEAAGGFDLLVHLVERLGRSSDEDNEMAIARETQCDGAANPAAGAGDNGNTLFRTVRRSSHERMLDEIKKNRSRG
jgi:hypothetical protein